MNYTIKPLDWKYDAVTCTWLADTPFGFFQIYESATVTWRIHSNHPDWFAIGIDVEDAKILAWEYWISLINPILVEII